MEYYLVGLYTWTDIPPAPKSKLLKILKITTRLAGLVRSVALTSRQQWRRNLEIRQGL